MLFAPLGIGAAMAATIGHQGLEILKSLSLLIGSLYGLIEAIKQICAELNG
jgi:proton glutamate symport protein